MLNSMEDRFMHDPTIRNGDRVTITFQNVSTGASFVAGIGRNKYVVELDGTHEIVTVPGYTITREDSE